MPSQKPQIHAHKLVHETAVGMAHALYDAMMSDNEWYRIWKNKNPGASPKALETRFVNKNVAKLLPQARAVLAQMLQGPMQTDLKDQIHEALVLDNQLVRGRGAPARMPKELH